MDKRRPSWGARTNEAVSGLTSRVDGQTAQVAQRAAAVIVPTVRLLRIPTLVLLLAPLPSIVATLWLGLAAGGTGGAFAAVLACFMALVSATFAVRRHRVLAAVDEPEQLATELGIAVSMSDRVDETRGVLAAIGGGGGPRLFSRLRGLWSGVSLTGRWIDGIGDLRRARYFLPPTIGTTVTITVVALWLVPVSVLVALFTAVGVLAGAL